MGRAHPITAQSIIIKVINSLRDQPAYPCRAGEAVLQTLHCKLGFIKYLLDQRGKAEQGKHD